VSTPDGEVVAIITAEYRAATNRARAWVMDRPWYGQLRAALVTEGQEQARAREHGELWIADAGNPPPHCGACPAGPFADMAAYVDHVRLMADPAYREPDPMDRLFGFPLEVRDGGGQPHLVDDPEIMGSGPGRA
jgi:hypothetical protein